MGGWLACGVKGQQKYDAGGVEQEVGTPLGGSFCNARSERWLADEEGVGV